MERVSERIREMEKTTDAEMRKQTIKNGHRKKNRMTKINNKDNGKCSKINNKASRKV